MKGNVIGFDPETNAGAISVHDGKRYDFVRLEWHGPAQPTRGTIVEFIPAGLQATRALANDPRTRTIPIIMVTSKGQETDRIWGLRQGAVDYMVKPVSPDQLVAKAQATLSA